MVIAAPERGTCTMADSQESCGLCITCNNAPSCFYFASRGPALVCELFDSYAPIETHLAQKSVEELPGAPFARSIADDEAGRSLGLCVNCENAPTCEHHKLTGGVWHCEEYC
jgi:hypothetical protein